MKLASAVAIDLGATSVRFAHGTFDGSKITFDIVEQKPNIPTEHQGKPCWDFETLLSFCKAACSFASQHAATVGIDSWGVDHGFFRPGEQALLQPPVCYRDPKHQEVFGRLAGSRHELYRRTGIAHQPFNTLYQLIARKEEHPEWFERGAPLWLILPDLLNCALCGSRTFELTQASTTQLMGVDGRWASEVFEMAGWPVPGDQPEKPGRIIGATSDGVPIVSVGSHDTASAVLGLGTLEPGEAFLNVGTWSLLGAVLDSPIVSSEAEQANFSNEWTVDGRIRFLKNIPGFYVINRLHEELGIAGSVPEWIARADRGATGRIDLLDEAFFNPSSMVDAVGSQLVEHPPNLDAWAGVALMSLVETTASQLESLEAITGKTFTKIRVAGGGSNSEAFCSALADVSRRTVLAGPSEATVLGNLGAQFLAQGRFEGWRELGDFLRRSIAMRVYDPDEA